MSAETIINMLKEKSKGIKEGVVKSNILEDGQEIMYDKPIMTMSHYLQQLKVPYSDIQDIVK